jgi:hypothetical protein
MNNNLSDINIRKYSDNKIVSTDEVKDDNKDKKGKENEYEMDDEVEMTFDKVAGEDKVYTYVYMYIYIDTNIYAFIYAYKYTNSCIYIHSCI